MGADGNGRALRALALAAAITTMGCAPRVVHRDYLPSGGDNVVRTPGTKTPGQRHVIPPNAVDERSAVLVYSTGGDVVDRGRRARIEVVFRARNDEPRPIAMQPNDTLLVLDARGSKPRVIEAASLDPGPGVRLAADDEVIVAPRTTAEWSVVFELPEGDNPLLEARTFLVSWTYRIGDEIHEERTTFASRRPITDGWVLPRRTNRNRWR